MLDVSGGSPGAGQALLTLQGRIGGAHLLHAVPVEAQVLMQDGFQLMHQCACNSSMLPMLQAKRIFLGPVRLTMTLDKRKNVSLLLAGLSAKALSSQAYVL